MASPLKLVKSLLHIVLSLQICLIAVISVLTYDRKAESFSTSDTASMYFLITKLATVPICLFGIMLTFVESAPLLLFLYLPLKFVYFFLLIKCYIASSYVWFQLIIFLECIVHAALYRYVIMLYRLKAEEEKCCGSNSELRSTGLHLADVFTISGKSPLDALPSYREVLEQPKQYPILNV